MQNRSQAICRLIFMGLLFSSTRFATADVINGAASFVITSGATSTSIVAPANVAYFNAYQNATVQVTGGQVSWLTLYGNSTASIYGGDISWLQLYDNSSVRITGIDKLSWLVFHGTTSRAELVANNVQHENGRLSGYWDNGTPFSFWAVSGPLDEISFTKPSNISISSVPGPSTALLLLGGIGLLVVRRTRGFA
jgi:hypothetical protein